MSVDARPVRRLPANPIRVAMAWLANSMLPSPPRKPSGFTPSKRQPYGKGTGRASYDVVQRRRAANKRARASRRINRGLR